jgi:Caspase domain
MSIIFMLRALVVGINDYPDSPLEGCVDDAIRVADSLRSNDDGSPNFACKVLTSPGDNVTRAILKENIQALFRQPADAALFYFSGHGSADNLDGYLITPDATSYDEGMPMRELLEIVAQAQKIREIVVLLDCCNSGGFANSPKRGATIPEAALREGISIITASRGEEESEEVDGGGLFTSLLVAALNGGAADILGRVTVPAIYSYVDQAMSAWEQRPLLKSHVSRLISLRKCRPSVTEEQLRRLVEYFPEPDVVLTLDKSYEPTEEPRGDPNEEIFRDLQKFRDARLVIPVDADALYWAAMHGTGCALTSSGRFYWQLVKEHKL